MALRPSMRPSAPELLPPSGRYGAPPESHRDLDEVDFDAPSQRALELEDGHEHRVRKSFAPTMHATGAGRVSHVSRVVAPLPPPSSRTTSSSSRGNLVVIGFLVAVGVASIMAGLWVVVALLAPT